MLPVQGVQLLVEGGQSVFLPVELVGGAGGERTLFGGAFEGAQVVAQTLPVLERGAGSR